MDDIKEQKHLIEILNKLSKVSERSDDAIYRMVDDIQDIKDARYKPYISTMATLLVLIIGVTGYVYNLETRLNAMIFQLNNNIHDVEVKTDVNNERLDVLAVRLEQRSNNTMQRWETHSRDHSSIDASFKIIAEKLIDVAGDKSTECPRP